jgi:hypothetical protein
LDPEHPVWILAPAQVDSDGKSFAEPLVISARRGSGSKELPLVAESEAEGLQNELQLPLYSPVSIEFTRGGDFVTAFKPALVFTIRNTLLDAAIGRCYDAFITPEVGKRPSFDLGGLEKCRAGYDDKRIVQSQIDECGATRAALFNCVNDSYLFFVPEGKTIKNWMPLPLIEVSTFSVNESRTYYVSAEVYRFEVDGKAGTQKMVPDGHRRP